jgi:hypothetical protein
MKEMGADWSMDQSSPPSPIISLSPYPYIYIKMRSCQENKILADSSTKRKGWPFLRFPDQIGGNLEAENELCLSGGYCYEV